MFQPMFMSSTASSALLPRHGATAECALSPWKVYSTETNPVPEGCPQAVVSESATCVNSTASTPVNTPSRTM